MKNIWKNIEKVGLISSIIVSVAALIISIKSCGDSNEALEITRKEFEAKRSLILQTNIGNMSPGFDLSTFDRNQKLQKLSVHLPARLQSKELQIEPPEFYFSLNELQDSLFQLVKLNIPNYKTDTRFHISSILVPAIIVSNYIVAGEVMWDTSFYNIEFYAQQDYYNNSSERRIEFRNLIFVSRWLDENDYYQSLDKYWKENFYASLKTLDSN